MAGKPASVVAFVNVAGVTQALDLTLALGYIERPVINTKVEKYLAKHHGEILNEFKKLLGERAEDMAISIPELGQPSARLSKH